jgi:hypothetical protein
MILLDYITITSPLFFCEKYVEQLRKTRLIGTNKYLL